MSGRFSIDERVIRLLEGGERFALLTHVNADGDGLGSQMALCGFLRSRGKQARMINNEPVSANYRFLALAPSVEVHPNGDSGKFVEDADGILVLDNGSLERLGSLVPHVQASRATKVCIDHHETRDDCWDLEVIDRDASASGEIVHEIIRVMNGDLSREMAEAIYVSLITDTGHFRFSKTRPLSHRIAASLLEKGIRPDEIFQKIYENQPEGFIRLMGHALLGVQRAVGGALAWTVLDREVQEKFGVASEDTGPIINTMLSIKGVRAALLFKELEDGKVKVSLRSKDEVDVHGLALRHGGGGHLHAAGILLPGPLQRVAELLVGEARALVGG